MRARRTLDAGTLKGAEEPHITGLLVKSARTLTESVDAEPWLEHLEIIDDPPQNDIPERVGKARPRIDIEFVQTGRGKRPRFHVEAKRLYRSDSVNEYFGGGGLGMFLNGTYARLWSSAGMIGYIQSDDRAVWHNKLINGFSTRKENLNTCREQSNWQPAGWVEDGLTAVQESCHERNPETLGKIGIYHLLLEFI